jgi:RNA ligase-like protein
MNNYSLSTMDQRRVQTATQYPSIPTYHRIDTSHPRHILSAELTYPTWPTSAPTLVTEKLDGVNARIICLPYHGGWIVGSRTELLTAQHDVIANPTSGICAALAPRGNPHSVANRIWAATGGDAVTVAYLEFYGRRGDQPAHKTYSSGEHGGWRLFDLATIDPDLLDYPVERLAAMRDHDELATWHTPGQLSAFSAATGVELVPSIMAVHPDKMPATLQDTRDWLIRHAYNTRAALDAGADPLRPAEGVVFRTPDRSQIAKARLHDYQRTLRALAAPAGTPTGLARNGVH